MFEHPDLVMIFSFLLIAGARIWREADRKNWSKGSREIKHERILEGHDELAVVGFSSAICVCVPRKKKNICHVLTSLLSMAAEAGTATNYFNLWLQDVGYSIYQVNVLPTAGNALSIVVAFIFGIIADRTGQRLLMIAVTETIVLLANILLSIWYLPVAVLLAANYLAAVGAAAQPIIIVSHQILDALGVVADHLTRRGAMS